MINLDRLVPDRDLQRRSILRPKSKAAAKHVEKNKSTDREFDEPIPD